MNSPLPAPAPAQRNWARLLANLLVALVVIVVAAAAFVFSYDGMHSIALLGGMSKQLARYYPGLFDAVLVIACVAAVMLRERWWARLWAWAVVIVVLAAIGAADVLHAANFSLPHRTTEGIVAAAPVVAVLLAFSLLLTLIRPYRTPDPEPVITPLLEMPALPAAVPPAPPIALPAAPDAPTRHAEAPTAPVRTTGDGPVPEAAPTREDPVFADAPEVPQAASGPAHPATAPNRMIAVPTEPPTVALPTSEPASRAAKTQEAAAAPGEPAPPTVLMPALSPEPAQEAPPARVAHGIRYAGNGVPGMAGKRAVEDGAATAEDYWDAEEGDQLAGLVYRARDDRADADDTADRGAAQSSARDDHDPQDDEPAPPASPAEFDDDAPPFATAPFAAVPRLNRVRSTPTPPADEEA